jgi:hypothetical protein
MGKAKPVLRPQQKGLSNSPPVSDLKQEPTHFAAADEKLAPLVKKPKDKPVA